MGLNRVLRPAAASALALLALWVAQQVPLASEANFGGSQGSSGIGGVTCASCHQPPHPTQDNAVAGLDGLPSTWRLGQTYELRISVTGGPDPLPAPAAQAGFDLATDGGTFAPDPAKPEAFQIPMDNEITYTAEGTHQRAWTVLWTAPTLERRPGPVHFWLATLSANGNHVLALNRSDGGETLDSTATLQAAVLPDPSAEAAWRALPLGPPTATAVPSPANNGNDGWIVEGVHRDGNATQLLYRLDAGPWQLRETGPAWRIRLPGGQHSFDYRSDGAGRSSPVQTLVIGDDRTADDRDDEARPASASVAAPASPAFSLPFLLALAALSGRTP